MGIKARLGAWLVRTGTNLLGLETSWEVQVLEGGLEVGHAKLAIRDGELFCWWIETRPGYMTAYARLVRRVVAEAKRRGFKRVGFSVDVKDGALREFYGRHGAQELAVIAFMEVA